MMDLIDAYRPVIDFFLISLGLAYSQQITKRAGVFSVAPAGFASLGAYCTAILVTRQGVSPMAGVVVATFAGLIVGGLLSIPLARLRGVFQAIATLAFVEIVVSTVLYAEDLTGGASGINNIPKVVTTWHLLAAVGVVMYFMWAIGRTGVGRAFDSLRQDETVAACLGVSIRRYHTLAFVISGALGGLFGGMQSLYVYSIDPSQFGFPLVVSVLAAIVLGGRATVIGPVIGTAILALLPELARPLAENRPLINGVLLIVIITFLPNGVGDSMMTYFRNRRIARGDRSNGESGHVVPAA